MPTTGAARPNQKRRTRKDLLQAAARLMKQGRRPNLEEIAEEALVSRATAYRYFPTVEALLAEAAADVVTPEAADLFAKGEPGDPVSRVEVVDTALHNVILANEAALRLMLANALQRGMAEEGGGKNGRELPLRQNRRSPLIEAALAPARRQFKPGTYDLLAKTLALIVGTEAMIVFKDVLQVPDTEARKIKRWAIRALVEAARR